MVALTCPFCCTETFDTPSALKSHLDAIFENLVCPICEQNFTLFEDWRGHFEICSNGHEGLVDERQEEDVGESILARALLEGPKCKEETEQAEYYCQSCDANFHDIDSHLGNFHEGQEIILEEETACLVPSPDQSVLLYVNTDESPEESQAPPTNSASLTEAIKDKDGRLYTRKFVKIDKFWLENKDIPNVIIEDVKTETETSEKIIDVTLCPLCNIVYPADTSHTCKPKKSHVCEVCNTSFPTFKSMRLHQRMHEPIKSRKIEAPANSIHGEESKRQMFVCKVCHKTYDKEYETVHMTSHDLNNGFNCEVCNRKFFTESNLLMHVKAHSNNKKFTCSYCKKTFVSYDSMNEHLTNQCTKRAYACQYCGRRFTRPHEKVKHERIHTGEKPHVCDICGKSFRVSYCLTLHLRTHSGTRPYQCNHCLKRFKSHSVYNHHLLTHSEVRAYKCPYCPKAFKTSVQLAGHKNSHIKPFACTECNRPFASLYAVRAHMETHKRDNNLKYDCWICGALYSRAFALKDHLKQQHEHVEGQKAKAEVVGVDEEMEAANSILVNEEDIILGLDDANIEIIDDRVE